MADFFQDRWNGVKNGLGTLYEGGARLIKQALGWQNIPEQSPGVFGWLIESGRAAIEGLFSKEKGLLRLDQGYKLSPLEKESVWNPFRHVRRGVSAVLNTATTFTTKFVGILNPAVGNFWSRALQGASTTVLAPFIGDISPYLGPAEPSVYNDGSYKVKHPEYYGAANGKNHGEAYPKATLPAPVPPPTSPQPAPPPTTTTTSEVKEIEATEIGTQKPESAEPKKKVVKMRAEKEETKTAASNEREAKAA